MATRKTGTWGGVRAGVGRKSIQPEERRRNRVMLNLTDEEYQALVDVAGDEPVSQLARDVLLRHLRRSARRPKRG